MANIVVRTENTVVIIRPFQDEYTRLIQNGSGMEITVITKTTRNTSFKYFRTGKDMLLRK